MYYTHDRCKAAWDEEKNDSYLGDSYSKIDEWGDYWSYLAAKYPDGTKGYQKKIIDLLENEKVLQPGITVMDIGCGPGTYGLQFIERGAGFIECVDSTDGMLKQLVIRAEERKIMDKIHISNSTWDQYKDKQTFDLVFSSMSPAISEYSELIKMETYSNRNCCLVTYGAGMPRTIRGRIWEKFNGKKAESGQKVSLEDEICADNIPVHKNEKKVLLLFNKPRGIVCSTKQQFDETTVTDYLDYPLRVYPVGRLDKESQGLLLLTNEGDLVNKIMRAGNYHEKEYFVTVNKPVDR